MRLNGTHAADSHLVIQGARVNALPCRPGDLLVLGSDGLFDNLTDEEIASIVEDHCAGVESLDSRSLDMSSWGPDTPVFNPRVGVRPTVQQLGRAADALVDAAIASVRTGPADSAAEEMEMSWEASQRPKPGGNADDTTALVAAVVEAGLDSEGEEEESSMAEIPQLAWCRNKPEGANMCGGGLLGRLLMPQCCNTTAPTRQEEHEEFRILHSHTSVKAIDQSELEDDRDGCTVS